MGSTEKETDSQRDHFVAMLRQFRDGMMITHATDGALHSRPMHLAKVEDDGTLWLFTDLRSAKVDELRHDARASLTFQDGGRFLALGGHAEVERDPRHLTRLFSEAMKVWFPEGPADPNVALIKIVPHGGEYWDNKGLSALTYAFAAARAYLTGTSPRLGADVQAKVQL